MKQAIFSAKMAELGHARRRVGFPLSLHSVGVGLA